MGHMLQPGLTPATHMVFISELTHKEELLTGLPGFSRTVFFMVLKHRDRFGHRPITRLHALNLFVYNIRKSNYCLGLKVPHVLTDNCIL